VPNPASNRAKLTQRYAETHRFPKGVEAYVFDTELPGFALRHYPSGKRGWMYRDGSKKHALGLITEINEKKARERVIDLRAAKRVNRDLITEERDAAAARKREEAVTRLTAGYCFEKFVNDPKAMPRSGSGHRKDSLTYIERYVLSHDAEMALPLSDISYRHIAKFVASVPEESWGIQDKLLGAISSAYSYFRGDFDDIGEVYEHLPTPPMDGLKPQRKRRTDRLTVEQLREVYAAAEQMSDQNIWHSAFFRMMILCLRRRGTVRAMRWDDLRLRPNDGLLPHWEVPAEFNRKGRTDGGDPQVLPLTPRMVQLIESIPFAGEYVFGGDKIRVSDGGKPLEKLREAVGFSVDDRGKKWTLHGLRRSVASSAIGKSHEDGIELVIGHRPQRGSKPSYWQGEYPETQLEALIAWDQLLFPE
jgi:integrase